jgi:prepilin-type N-terminal cleavage/methylation domain-containing protein
MRKGFTLIELLITIAIIATVMQISFAGLSVLSRSVSLSSSATQLEGNLYMVKQKAVSIGNSCRMTCSSGEYIIEVFDARSGTFSEIKRAVLGNGLNFKNSFTFLFSSNGFPVPGYFGTATIQDSAGRSKKVVVSSVGRIRTE